MKKIFALALAMMAGTAFSQDYESSDFGSESVESGYSQNIDAQAQEAGGGTTTALADPGNRHMFEFNIDSIMAAAISFDKVKVKGADSDNDTNMNLSFNYFYGVHRLLQAGFRFDYFNGVAATEDAETLNLEVGAYLNHDEDFSRAAFIGAFVGGGWAQQFGDNASRDDLRSGTISVGKRFPLDRWGIKHVTYTPELALKMVNSTTDESIDYTQSLQLRLLQFSVIF